MVGTARVQVDPALVERYVMELARFGAYGETGVWRTVYDPEWVAAADQYAAWCEEAELATRRDAVGNVWGRLEGSEGGKAIVSGSHIDSQRPGGRYDGALGAMGALIAIRTLKEQFGQPKRTLEAVAFCEEEGSRFPSAQFWGSRGITGAIGPDDAEQTRGYGGESVAEAMRAIGLDPARIPEAKRDDIETFVELHIEQGPILEQAGYPVGVVQAITGIRHLVVELRGTANHAGAFPMDLRRDPMAGAAEIISGVINTAHRMGRPAVTTCGWMEVDPNGPAIVPERVRFTIDARHPDPEQRELLYARHEALVKEVAARRDLEVSFQNTLELAPIICDADVVALIDEAARAQGIPTLTMTSGAVHDTQRMAELARVAMIFVQSRDGRSHTPDEFSSIEHCTAGIEVLAAALHRLAY
ncbi:MAG: allantoate deiminase [Thermomicrobiales bacterium]|nr:allantoate deiminase [Thermomicrobiales bacterium]